MSARKAPSREQQYPRVLSLFAHELRTPLSVVAGYLRLLPRDPESALTERQLKMIEEAQKSCDRITALASELSDLARLDSGSAAIADQPFDLFEMVADVAQGIHEAEDRGVRLEMAGEAAGAPLRGDLARLKAAFRGCFRAVLREQPTSCTVIGDRRRVVHDGATSAVVVIAESSHVEQAFSAPRSRLDVTRAGLGLALPIAARMIEHHRGSVWSPATHNLVAIVASFPLGAQRGEETLRRDRRR